MTISYREVMNWFKANFKLLMMLEALCLLAAGIYFAFAPRIYEASFSIGLPKVVSAAPTNLNLPKLRLLISPQEFIRPTQDPMAYSEEFIKNCMGEDTNANRKEFINSLQLGVKQQGDVIAFTLRLKGSERAAQCANLLMPRVLEGLVVSQDRYLEAAKVITSDPTNFSRPALVQAIRLSDSYIKPDFNRLLMMAIIAGIGLTIFISLMKNKYRA
jgi:capsular polysaccharide biosynthesis protein